MAGRTFEESRETKDMTERLKELLFEGDYMKHVQIYIEPFSVVLRLTTFLVTARER